MRLCCYFEHQSGPVCQSQHCPGWKDCSAIAEVSHKDQREPPFSLFQAFSMSRIK